MREKINLVYWIAARLNKPAPTYSVACRVADRFTLWELERMYCKASCSC